LAFRKSNNVEHKDQQQSAADVESITEYSGAIIRVESNAIRWSQ